MAGRDAQAGRRWDTAIPVRLRRGRGCFVHNKTFAPVTLYSPLSGHADRMIASVPPLIESHHPATFRTRGIAAPFTTPLLAGARVRESRHSGIEVVVPNPSGGRGVYILHWPGVCALCKPTVHDTMLFRRFSGLADIDTAHIRGAALDIALEGHAGRNAKIAAETAVAADRSERLLAHFLLLMGLVEQVDPKGGKTTSLTERTPDLDRRTSVALHRVASAVGRPAAHLAGGLAAIADAFAPLGVAQDDRSARIPRLLLRLEEACGTLSGWLSDAPENDIGGLGELVTVALRSACDSGTAILRTTRLPLGDPVALLKNWCADPVGVEALAERCDALLDGWERVCLVWLCAATAASRRAALLEMIPLMPVLPRQVMDWTGVAIPAEAMDPACRLTSQQDAWRSGGAAFALIERNEILRAMSL